MTGEGLMIPYPGAGSGHAGNDTSRERQEREDSSGKTLTRQRQVLAMVRDKGRYGVTVADVEDILGIGHGQASSALTHLHRAGHLVRLKERRGTQEVYVTESFIAGRELSPYRPRQGRPHPRDLSKEAVLNAMSAASIDAGNYRFIRKFLEHLP